MAAVNDKDILILGGDGITGFEQDVYIFNTKTNTMIKKLDKLSDDGSFKVSTWSN